MDLSGFPRRNYTAFTTPIVKAEKISKLLGGPSIYIKRDDLLGLAGGGNKTRKLEFLVADALQQGADTLITCGAIQSNHCRLTLSAATTEGLKCRLVLEERIPGSYDPKATGNNLLYHLIGAEEIKLCADARVLDAEMQRVADAVKEAGGSPYIIPLGGSTPLGALGYLACAGEIAEQSDQMRLRFDRVVCVSGSGGTQAGLTLGMHSESMPADVIGINVGQTSRNLQEELVYTLVEETSDLLGLSAIIPRAEVRCVADYVGKGYSVLTDEVIEAIRLTASTEGILLDPVYTGKAMAGLIDMIRRGEFTKEEKVLFVHTGGSPALYAYAKQLLSDPATA